MTPDSHWTGAVAVPTGPGDCREPAVTVAGEVLHAVWTQGSILYHAYLAGGSWSAPNRVATGSQAVLATAPDGGIHCLFSAQMLGNVEIYHTTWQGAKWALPEVVSRTSGMSLSPALAIGKDGSLHAAWSDMTPGYATIYYGRRVAGRLDQRPHPQRQRQPPGDRGRSRWPDLCGLAEPVARHRPVRGLLCAEQPRRLVPARECLGQQPEPCDLPQPGDHSAGHLPSRLARGSRRIILHSARRPVSQRLVRESCSDPERRRLSIAAHLRQPPGLPPGGLGGGAGRNPPNPPA